MYLKNIELTNFRSHQKLKIDFQGNVIVIYGPNGKGKTNILEAIHFLSTGKSLRSQYDSDSISHDEKFLKLKSDVVVSDGDNTNLELIVDKTNSFGNRSIKKFKINQVPKQGSKFTGMLKSVIFLPSDLDLLLSSPSIRRKYLDSIFYQTSSEYKSSILDYTKALKQRNKILELMFEENNINKSHFESQLDFWTSKIISEGTLIQKHREDFFVFLRENLFSLNEKLGLLDFHVEFKYVPNLATKENYHDSKDKEFFTRTTQFGPHKDDFEILLNDKNIQYFASRGQQRVSLIILKIIELEYISQKTNERPILLLDDIFSELDDKHKNSILKIIKEQQTFISSVYKLSEFEELSDQIIDIEEIG